ncbi:MAG: hypothetical protein Q9203_006727, partial [Teloschistes exilis]
MPTNGQAHPGGAQRSDFHIPSSNGRRNTWHPNHQQAPPVTPANGRRNPPTPSPQAYTGAPQQQHSGSDTLGGSNDGPSSLPPCSQPLNMAMLANGGTMAQASNPRAYA